MFSVLCIYAAGCPCAAVQLAMLTQMSRGAGLTWRSGWPCSHRDVAPLRAWLLACTAEQLFKGNADPLGMLTK